MPRKTTNPAGQGRGGRDRVKCFIDEADSTTSTPAAQAVTCVRCVHFIPRPRRSRCRWTGERVNASSPCPDCRGFRSLNGGGGAA